MIRRVYADDRFALLTDLRSPYTQLGDHVEWHQQFRACIASRKTHTILSSKLAKFAPFILIYSKIWPDRDDCVKLSGFVNPTICVVSSVGEHAVTPWMIIHNIGHTYLSWHVAVRQQVATILGLDPEYYPVAAMQNHLVKSAAARKGLIPNMAEILYELYTTWVWYGNTRSGNQELAKYCDQLFSKIMIDGAQRIVWHQYRPPTESSDVDVSGLATLL